MKQGTHRNTTGECYEAKFFFQPQHKSHNWVPMSAGPIETEKEGCLLGECARHRVQTDFSYTARTGTHALACVCRCAHTYTHAHAHTHTHTHTVLHQRFIRLLIQTSPKSDLIGALKEHS